MHPHPAEVASWPKASAHPAHRGPALVVVNAIFISLVLITVALRYYTRIRITGSFGTDDVVIGLSLFPTIALCVVVFIADRHYGWNKHSWDLDPTKGPSGYKLCLSAQFLLFWAATLNKMSLLVFYRRLITSATGKIYSWLINGGLAIMGAVLLAFTVAAACACRPMKAFWAFYPPDYEYHCIDEGGYMMAFGIITIFLNFFTLAMSVPPIWCLRLPVKQKLAALSLFSMGIVVCIAGIVQVYYVQQSLVSSYDETWTGWPLWLCSAVEVDVGILCVSLPAIRPLLAKYIPRLLESTRGGSSKANSKETEGTEGSKDFKNSQVSSDGSSTECGTPTASVFAKEAGADMDLERGERGIAREVSFTKAKVSEKSEEANGGRIWAGP
ncbi:MAG: hypothetical protein M1836_000097 [Candelina mexicana]|nr:MAG: hypothetical protein M1836_000097 [Candelina mexicana]